MRPLRIEPEQREAVSRELRRTDLGERFRELLAAPAPIASRGHASEPASDPLPPEPEWIFDAPRDHVFAHGAHPAFDNVLTVFTQEWVGIRAAAGSFPGRKLAVSKSAAWSNPELRRIFHLIDTAGIKTVVAQGACFPLLDFLELLRKAMPELTIVGVWHGSLAAWAFDEERALAARFLELASKGVFDRISLLRYGMHLLHERAVPYLTPNLVPRLEMKRLVPAFGRKPATCIFAGWNNQWKNMYANLVAAAASDSIGKILTYAPASLPGPLGAKLGTLSYGTRKQHFVALANADLALNVTTVDCHPMVEMEALAVGTPVLRGQLDLDFGADHAFARLLTVESPHDLPLIKARIEAVASVPPAELADIVSDYRTLVIKTSFERYGEFLRSGR